MQENRSTNRGEGLQKDQNMASEYLPSDKGNTAQQAQQPRPIQDEQTSLEPSEIDQQEGNMNHGTLGGNFGEE